MTQVTTLHLIIVVDDTAPSVSIMFPSDGATVNGKLLVYTAVSDDIEISLVNFYIDGKLKQTVYGDPYLFRLNTNGQSPGSHIITAEAVDTSGNTSSDSISVQIAEKILGKDNSNKPKK